MGNVASRLDDAGNLFFKDQNRCRSKRRIGNSSRDTDEISIVSIASVTISNPRRRLLTLSPNAFPAARFVAKRDAGDDTPIEYIQVRSAQQLECLWSSI